ncbi:MBL fold metallo-hydrolase, partial [Candidatus Woesearchaeota archaeon]
MSEIIKEIMKHLSKDDISDVSFEGANIVLYTTRKEFFLNDQGKVRDVVNKIKKRIELRPDPSIVVAEEAAQGTIMKLLGEDAGVTQMFFEPDRSLVTIEVERPGIAIGKGGENLQRIKEETLWVPVIKRTPPIRSEIIEGIRAVLYEHSDYRRKFLHKTGERIYNGWLRQKKEEWIRVTYLGAARQVGRSAILLQTPESRVLFDCGIDPANTANQYPYLEAPEFRINELDAVVITHAHLDHSGLLPYLFKFGYRGPVYCTAPTRDIMALLQLDTIKIARNEGQDPIYSSDDIKEVVKHTIVLDYGEVTDVTPDVRITLYN